MSHTLDLPAIGRAAYSEQAAGRREDYAWLRDNQGLTIEEAAARVGVGRRQAERYEAQLRGTPTTAKAPPWTEAETALALRRDLTARQVAAITGRTFLAVKQRRHYVRTREATHG